MVIGQALHDFRLRVRILIVKVVRCGMLCRCLRRTEVGHGRRFDVRVVMLEIIVAVVLIRDGIMMRWFLEICHHRYCEVWLDRTR